MTDNSTWIAIDLMPLDTALVLPGEEYHLTLAYLNEPELSEGELFGLQSIVANWIMELWPYTQSKLDVIGHDYFGPAKNIKVAKVDLPPMFERNELVDRLNESGMVEVATTYDFDPHVTLGKVWKGWVTEAFHIKGVYVMHKGRKILDFRYNGG